MSRYIDMCMQRRCMLCTALVQFMLRLMHAHLVHTCGWCMDGAVVLAGAGTTGKQTWRCICVLTLCASAAREVRRDDARERPDISGPL